MLNGESGKQIALLSLLVCIFPSSLVQYQITVPIPFGIRYFPPIVDTPLEIVGYILSVNMSSFEHMCAFVYFSTMNVDLSNLKPTLSEYSTLEESILFEKIQQTKGLFLVWPLGVLFLSFQMGLIGFGLSLLFMHFYLSKSTVGTLNHLSLTLSSLYSLCKNTPLNIRMIVGSNKI